MAKNLRFLSVFFLLSLLFAVLPAGQSHFTTFFGPVEFVRNTGRPVIETKEFSATGVQAPFFLHLRNGDSNGKHRVSSAKIWLNGDLLFRTSDFSQQVEGYVIEVELQPQNTLEVELRSKKGTKLKIWIDGIAAVIAPEVILDEGNCVSAIISPEIGGVLETIGSNGSRYVLDIPPNALLQEAEINLTPVLDIIGLPMASGMFVAVQISPQDLYFMEPVTLTIELPFPAPPYMTGFKFNNDGSGFHLHPIESDGSRVTFELMHFSTAGIATITEEELERMMQEASNLKGIPLFEHLVAIINADMDFIYGPGWKWVDQYAEIWANRLQEALYEWFFNENGMQYILDRAAENPDEYFDAVPPAIMYVYRKCDLFGLFNSPLPAPTPCDVQYHCVTYGDLIISAEKRMVKILEDTIISANEECINGDASQEGRAADYICKATRLESLGFSRIDPAAMRELKTCGIWSLEVNPETKVLDFNDSVQIEAIAKDKDGNRLEGRNLNWWVPEVYEDLITVDQTGFVQSYEKEGDAGVYVYDVLTKCMFDAYSRILVREGGAIRIVPSEKTISIGEELTLVAITYVDVWGDPCRPIDWTIPSQEVIGVVSTGDASLTIVGASPGTVTITATCDGESATATITVEAAGVVEDVEFGSHCCWYLYMGHKVQFRVTFKDAEGRPIPPISENVEYYSWDESIFKVNLISGNSAEWVFELEAIAEGLTHYTISYDNGAGKNFIGGDWHKVQNYGATGGQWNLFYENMWGVWDQWRLYDFKFEAGYLYFVYSDGTHYTFPGRDPEDPPEYYDGTYTVEYNGEVPTRIIIHIKYIERLYPQIIKSPPGEDDPDWYEWTFTGNFEESYSDCPKCFDSNEIRGTHHWRGWRIVSDIIPPDWLYVDYEGTFKLIRFIPGMSAQNTEPYLQYIPDRSDSGAIIAKTKILEDGRKITKNCSKSEDKVDK